MYIGTFVANLITNFTSYLVSLEPISAVIKLPACASPLRQPSLRRSPQKKKLALRRQTVPPQRNFSSSLLFQANRELRDGGADGEAGLEQDGRGQLGGRGQHGRVPAGSQDRRVQVSTTVAGNFTRYSRNLLHPLRDMPGII